VLRNWMIMVVIGTGLWLYRVHALSFRQPRDIRRRASRCGGAADSADYLHAEPI
jgi:hypothetical protein